jgi:hypothetical protein
MFQEGRNLAFLIPASLLIPTSCLPRRVVDFPDFVIVSSGSHSQTSSRLGQATFSEYIAHALILYIKFVRINPEFPSE